jgi:hypothetical protein
VTGFDIPILKAASTAIPRAIGWGVHAVRAGTSERATRKMLEPPPDSRLSLVDATANLPPATIELLNEFLISPEIDQLAYALASEHVLGRSGREVRNRRDALKLQLTEQMRLRSTPDSDITEFAGAVFDAVDNVLQINLVGVETESMAPSLRAGLIKSAASTAAAVSRNTELLKTITDIAAIGRFERDFSSQVAALHGIMRLPHAGTTKQVPYERLFVQPNVSTSPFTAGGESFKVAPTPLNAIIGDSLRTVLLGNPGGGKSTSSLKLAYDVASGRSSLPGVSVPFHITLKDFAERFKGAPYSLTDFMHELCGTPYNLEAPDGAIEYLLLNGHAIVIFDGLDELLDVSLRRKIVQAVEGFAHRFPTTPIVVTSREVGYDEAALDSDLFVRCTLQPFDQEQVEAYVRRWFTLDDSVEPSQKDRLAGAFLVDSQFVSDLTTNPLMLSLMCGIYASEHYIPRNRPDVYEKCALLLFERWDKHRGIKAELAFDAHVQDAMRSLALWLYPQHEAQKGLPRHELISFMTQYLLDRRFEDQAEAEQAAAQFVDFCKGRAWVLTDIGAERYGFTHRTFLEYFAASQLVRQFASAELLYGELRLHILNAEWDTLAQLALQILGKSVADGADEFLALTLHSLEDCLPSERRNILSFMTRSLDFIVPRPAVLRQIVGEVLNFYEDETRAAAMQISPDVPDPMASLLASAPENLPRIQRYLQEKMDDTLEPDGELRSHALLSIALYPSAHIDYRTTTQSSSFQFWRDAELQSYPAVKAAATSRIWSFGEFPWITLWGITAGVVRVDDLVSRAGISALFQGIRIPPVTRTSSIAFMLISEHTRENRSPSSVWQRKDVAASLLEQLLSADLPWISAPIDVYDPWAAVVLGEYSDRLVKQSPLQEVAILLSMGFAELKRTAAQQKFENGLRQILPELQTLDGFDQRVSEFARSWLNGEVALTTSGIHPRRVVRGPGRGAAKN